MKRTLIFTLIIWLVISIFSYIPADATTYEYDKLNQLVKVDYGNGIVTVYTYDSTGNVSNVQTQKTASSLLITQTTPASGAYNVSADTPVKIIFDEEITVSEKFNNISLRKGTSVVKILLEIEGKTLKIETLQNLQAGSEYHLFVPSGAVRGKLSSLGNPDISLFFRTGNNSSNDKDAQPNLPNTNVDKDSEEGQITPDSVTPYTSLKLESGENYTRVHIAISEIQSRIDTGLKKIIVDMEPADGPLLLLLSREMLQALNASQVSLELQTSWGNLIIPPGVLPVNEEISLLLGPGTTIESESLMSAGQAITIDFQGASLLKPAVLALKMNAGPQEDPASLFIYRLNHDGSLTCMGGEVNGQSIVLNRQSFSTYAVMNYTNSFDDIKTHWAKRAILFLASQEIIHGVDSCHFEPDRPVTRAEFTTMVVNSLGLSAGENSPGFRDVSDTSWYTPTVKAAYQAGLINGTGNGCFQPERTITREEMAALIMNAWTLKHKHNYAEESITYTDKESISIWARESISRAGQLKIMQGNPDGSFRPHENATRAEAAIVIGKLLQED